MSLDFGDVCMHTTLRLCLLYYALLHIASICTALLYMSTYVYVYLGSIPRLLVYYGFII